MILVDLSGANATVRKNETLTVGMVGAQVQFCFDKSWEGLAKTAVFRQGDVVRDMVNIGELCTVPPEVLRYAGLPVEIGVYGVSAGGNLVIPTVWTMTGPVRAGADPSGDESTDPTLPVWAQILAQIGSLDDLDTAQKESLVAAVNEVLSNAISEDGLSAALNAALAQAKESGLFNGAPGRDGVNGKDGDPGEDYVLTDDDRQEIAQQAAEIVAGDKMTLKIQFFGDSVTDESWRSLPGWPSYLAGRLPGCDLTVKNSAVGGNTLTRYQNTVAGEPVAVTPTKHSHWFLIYSKDTGVPKLGHMEDARYSAEVYQVEGGVTYRFTGSNIGLPIANYYPLMMFTDADTVVDPSIRGTYGVDIVSDDGSFAAYGEVKGPLSVDFEYTPPSNGWVLVSHTTAYPGELTVTRPGEEATYYKGVAWQMGLTEPTVGMYNDATKVYDNLESDNDLVIVLAGTNDWAGTNYNIGSLMDGSLTTIYGATQKIIEAVSATNSKLLIVTPMQRLNAVDEGRFENDLGQKVNSKGYSLEQFANAIKEVCTFHAVPCLDLYHTSGVNTLNINQYTTDGLHTNEAGARRLAKLIANAVQEVIS